MENNPDNTNDEILSEDNQIESDGEYSDDDYIDFDDDRDPDAAAAAAFYEMARYLGDAFEPDEDDFPESWNESSSTSSSSSSSSDEDSIPF